MRVASNPFFGCLSPAYVVTFFERPKIFVSFYLLNLLPAVPSLFFDKPIGSVLFDEIFNRLINGNLPALD